MDPVLRSFAAQLGLGSSDELMVVLVDQNFAGSGQQQSMTMEEFRAEINETAAKVVAKYLDNTNAGDVEQLSDIKDVINEDVQNDLQRRKVGAKALVQDDELAECVAKAVDEAHDEWLEFAETLNPIAVLSQHDLRNFQDKQRSERAGAIGMPWSQDYVQPDPRHSKPYYRKPEYGRYYHRRKDEKKKRQRKQRKESEGEGTEEEEIEEIEVPIEKIDGNRAVFVDDTDTSNVLFLYKATENTPVKIEFEYQKTRKNTIFGKIRRTAGKGELPIELIADPDVVFIFPNGIKWMQQRTPVRDVTTKIAKFNDTENLWAITSAEKQVVAIPTYGSTVEATIENENSVLIGTKDGEQISAVVADSLDTRPRKYQTVSKKPIYVGSMEITEINKKTNDKTVLITEDFVSWNIKSTKQRLPGKWQAHGTSASLSDYSDSLRALAQYLVANPQHSATPLHFFAPTNESLAMLSRLAPPDQRLDLDRIVQKHLQTPTHRQIRPQNAQTLGRQRLAGHEVKLYGISTVLK